ncbi:TIGR00341 family protein [Halovivax cerinus]|uniref:TIGR00341 family protein n=1 Tax=Halovivax cerinus TaxID=1487865 RepID=A0ABD5NN03_9EURY|nr:TIGR00341 family protein [Halovivax cerinus]
MRLVQLYVPRGERETVLATLDAAGVEYGLLDETSDGAYEAVASIPVPTGAVDSLLARIRDAGLHDDTRIVVLGVEASVGGADADADRDDGGQLARDELRARAIDLAPAFSTFAVLLVLSSVIATAGLLTDSAATIIGAMVVAPLMGPALTASVGVVVDDDELASRGVTLQLVGLVLTVVTAALLGYLLRGTVLLPPGLDIVAIPQVAERVTPSLLSLFLALGSGAAAVVSLTRNVGSVLVGVAIAVALVPPAATAGLGIAWGDPMVVLTAGTLVLVNVLAINLSALVLLWMLGYRPHSVDGLDRTVRRLVARSAILFVSIGLLSVVLIGMTVGTYQVASVTHDVDTELESMNDAAAFDAYEFHEVDVSYAVHDVYTGEPASVTVLAERPPGNVDTTGLADRVRDRLESATGREVDVVVELVDTQRSS